MLKQKPTPDFHEFCALAHPGAIVPVYIEIPFDLDTPVTAFQKLRDPPFSFLLESAEGAERWARFSFLGSSPRDAWRLTGGEIQTWKDGVWDSPRLTEDPYADFENWMGHFEPVPTEEIPGFWGGAVGYFGYDMVRWSEKLPNPPPDDVGIADALFIATKNVLIIDNLYSRAFGVTSVPIPHTEKVDLDNLRTRYEKAVKQLGEWLSRLDQPHTLPTLGEDDIDEVELTRNRSKDDYESAVSRIQKYIAAGDAYQVVISQRTSSHFVGDPLQLYRALRQNNPSPYLFFMELDGAHLIGSSPETLVRVEDNEVTLRPIAGTRPRGLSPTEDAAFEASLLADEKERSEHLMLVDLGRNDVSRVATPGSVRIPRFMEIERYSHVMHLVSEVVGALKPGLSAIDAFRACFPAGTLTGAPKIRAMEIIDELEPTRRGPYGGAAGYISYGAQNLDMAIVIRTLLSVADRVYAQAGAGVVYESDPTREWEETEHKAQVLFQALASARMVD